MTKLLWAELWVELAFSLSCAGWWIHAGGPNYLLWALPLAVFVGLRAVLVLASIVFAVWRQRRPSLPALAWVKLAANESWALLRFCGLMLSEFGDPRTVYGKEVSAHTHHPTLVVLMHGVYCNRGVWRPVRRRLVKHAQVRVAVPTLTPVTAGLAQQAQGFAQWLDALVKDQPQRVVLIGHSMGGLIARLCITQGLLRTSVHKLICLGSPHAGSELAKLLSGEVGRDLSRQSEVLADLEAAASASTAVVNLYSRHDNLVAPYESAYLPHATNLVLDGIGHMSLVYSRQVYAALLHELHKD